MPRQKHLKLAVQNFGPIRKGEFELKPLTVFIGPNNSGKSYMALLAYVLLESLSSRVARPLFTLPFVESFFGLTEKPEALEVQRQLLDWLRSTAGRESTLADVPSRVAAHLIGQIRQRFARLEEELPDTLSDYFGYNKPSDLVRFGQPTERFAIVAKTRDAAPPLITLGISSEGNWGAIRCTVPDLHSTVVTAFEPPADPEAWIDTWLRGVSSAILAATGIDRHNSYYLPPARSGILQAWPLFASMAVQLARRNVGLRRLDVPALTGVTADFLQLLLEKIFPRDPLFMQALIQAMPEVRARADLMGRAVRVLEEEILRGEVAIEHRAHQQPDILYRHGPQRFPLPRASSMVAELAPLDLLVRELVGPGDLVVIDEPEAHLHPENQRRVARVLVRLARAGVYVLCPTHSSLILHQVSNHILASQADAETRQELGFTDEDLLSPNDVGVYLFDLQEDGTEIKPVPIEPGFGISEDEFVRVAEAIGDETYKLIAPSARPA